mmetsp:Transcript_39897/g.114954  ORF Transcript_39897/g.114954 Transcript_39897/m.114954 type:complete len:793 (-) Transcript_39897:264-2642(-)
MVTEQLKRYLLKDAICIYVENSEQVLRQLSFRQILLGQVRLDEVKLAPSCLQDAAFKLLPPACEILCVDAYNVQVDINWHQVLTRSVEVRVERLEIEVALRDPNNYDDAFAFWDAQLVRSETAREAGKSPVEGCLAYKIGAGVDVTVKEIQLLVQTPRQPRPEQLPAVLRFAASGFQLRPADEDGEPTSSLSQAVRVNPVSPEIGYGQCISVESARWLFCTQPWGNGFQWQDPHMSAEVRNVCVSSLGICPAAGKFEAAFCGESMMKVQIGTVATTGAPIPALALGTLLWTGTLAAASFSNGIPKGHDVPGNRMRLHSWARESRGQTSSFYSCIAPEDELSVSDSHSREYMSKHLGRTLSTLLQGCRQASSTLQETDHHPPIVEKDDDSLWATSTAASEDDAEADLNRRNHALSFMSLTEDAADSSMQEVQEAFGIAGQKEAEAAEASRDRWFALRRGGRLARSMISIGSIRLWLAVEPSADQPGGGDVGLELADFRVSSDQRAPLSKEQQDCLDALLDRSAPSGIEGTGEFRPGVLRAALSLTSLVLQCRTGGCPAADMLRVTGGLTVQHRGDAAPFAASSGLLAQAVEVHVAEVRLCSVGRNLLSSAMETLKASLAPSSGGSSSSATAPFAELGCSIEVTDVTVELQERIIGDGASPESWCVKVPSLHIERSLGGALSDLWRLDLWCDYGPDGLGGPLGAVPIGGASSAPLAVERLPRRLDRPGDYFWEARSGEETRGKLGKLDILQRSLEAERQQRQLLESRLARIWLAARACAAAAALVALAKARKQL